MLKNEKTTIIFDYGCVLSNSQNSRIFNQIHSMVTDSNFSVFEETYYRLRADYDQGLVSGREYWKGIFKYFNSPYTEELADRLIKMDAESWSSINTRMKNFVEELKSGDFRIAVLSNMPKEILRYLNDETDFFSVFDYTVFSCDLKLIKPDPEIYRKTLGILGCSGEETVFIDDREENIAAAEKEGMKGLIFTGFEKLHRDMKKILGTGKL